MNWKNEAIERLNKYEAMKQSLDNIPLEIKRLKKSSSGLRSVSADRIRVSSSPSRQEDILIGNLIKQEELTRSYENAKLWVETTNMALSALTEEEEMILRSMYISPQRGVVNHLCEKLGVEQSSIYRKRDSALYHFTVALYGIS